MIEVPNDRLKILKHGKALIQVIWTASPGLFFMSLSLSLLLGLLPTANIFIVSQLIESLVIATTQDGLPPRDMTLAYTIALGVLTLVSTILQKLRAAVSQLQQTRVSNAVLQQLVEKSASMSLARFEDRDFHNKLRTASDQASFRPKMILDQVMQGISSIATVISLSWVLATWNVWIAIGIWLTSLITLWVSVRFGAERASLVIARAETERKKFYFSNLLTSDLAAKEIRAFDLGHHFVNRFRHLLEMTYNQDLRLVRREIRYSLPADSFIAIVHASMIGFTALQSFSGALSVGQFSLYFQAIIQLDGYLREIAQSAGGLRESSLYVTQLFTLLEEEDAEAHYLSSDASGASEPPSLLRSGAHMAVEFRNISFSYPGTKRLVLKDMNFTISAGKTTAIVGKNGTGKSSIVKLITGLYYPAVGEVLIDGVDSRLLDPSALRQSISVVFQDQLLYHLPVDENIWLGKVEQQNREVLVKLASVESGLHQVVEQLPDGYDTVLSRFWDRGHELSGGQKQLVGLARALFRDAPLLILDEPSSALDVHAERQFFERLFESIKDDPGKTLVYVSHRFTTVSGADQIIVVDDGRVVAVGNHTELMDTELYSSMYQSQSEPLSFSRTTDDTVGR